MNSEGFSGEVNSLSTKLVVLSFAMSIDENSDKKLSPNTVIPGASFEITNISGPWPSGMPLLIADKSSSKTIGKAMPNISVRISLVISFVLREANVSVLILPPPL